MRALTDSTDSAFLPERVGPAAPLPAVVSTNQTAGVRNAAVDCIAIVCLLLALLALPALFDFALASGFAR